MLSKIEQRKFNIKPWSFQCGIIQLLTVGQVATRQPISGDSGNEVSKEDVPSWSQIMLLDWSQFASYWLLHDMKPAQVIEMMDI